MDDRMHDCYIWHVITLAKMKYLRKECKKCLGAMVEKY